MVHLLGHSIELRCPDVLKSTMYFLYQRVLTFENFFFYNAVTIARNIYKKYMKMLMHLG